MSGLALNAVSMAALIEACSDKENDHHSNSTDSTIANPLVAQTDQLLAEITERNRLVAQIPTLIQKVDIHTGGQDKIIMLESRVKALETELKYLKQVVKTLAKNPSSPFTKHRKRKSMNPSLPTYKSVLHDTICRNFTNGICKTLPCPHGFEHICNICTGPHTRFDCPLHHEGASDDATKAHVAVQEGNDDKEAESSKPSKAARK